VVLGTIDRTLTTEPTRWTTKIFRKITHPDYNFIYSDNDLALLKMFDKAPYTSNDSFETISTAHANQKLIALRNMHMNGPEHKRNSFILGYIYPIILPRYQDVNNTFVGFYATASGWGRTEGFDLEIFSSNILKKC
jgi:hypothetical protein